MTSLEYFCIATLLLSYFLCVILARIVGTGAIGRLVASALAAGPFGQDEGRARKRIVYLGSSRADGTKIIAKTGGVLIQDGSHASKLPASSSDGSQSSFSHWLRSHGHGDPVAPGEHGPALAPVQSLTDDVKGVDVAIIATKGTASRDALAMKAFELLENRSRERLTTPFDTSTALQNDEDADLLAKLPENGALLCLMNGAGHYEALTSIAKQRRQQHHLETSGVSARHEDGDYPEIMIGTTTTGARMVGDVDVITWGEAVLVADNPPAKSSSSASSISASSSSSSSSTTLSPTARYVHRLLQTSWCPTTVSLLPSSSRALIVWSKLIVNATINTLTATVTRQPNGTLEPYMLECLNRIGERILDPSSSSTSSSSSSSSSSTSSSFSPPPLPPQYSLSRSDIDRLALEWALPPIATQALCLVYEVLSAARVSPDGAFEALVTHLPPLQQHYTSYTHTVSASMTLSSALSHAITLELVARGLLQVLKVVRSSSTNRSSMLADVDNGRVTESEYIHGYIIDVAQRGGVQLPTLVQLYKILQAHDEQVRAKQQRERKEHHHHHHHHHQQSRKDGG